MIEGLKPYAKYKESEIPWAPAIPSSWKTERAKRLFTKMQRPVRPEDDVVTCFRDGMVTLRKNRRLRGFTEATAFSGYQGIRKGDLVIHGMDAFAGAIGVSDSDGQGTPVYNVCKPRPGVIASYYAYTVREMSRAQWILALAKGIRERSTDFRYEMFGNQFVPLPPLDEQAAIVRFLDHANRKIDGFIRAKRKLIGLLNEQKQAIIHRAVTRGIDTDIELKPSGVNYLGDIPKHWNVAPARAVFTEVIERGHPKEQMLSVTIRRGIITQSQLLENSIKKDSSRQDKAAYKLVCVGDIAYNKMRAWQGAFGVSDLQGIVSPAYVVVRSKSLADIRFYHYLFRTPTFASEAERWSYGIASDMWSLRPEHFRLIKLPIPPETEQNAIGMHLDRELVNYNAAIARTEREIIIMQEYRTRLIADIVTGKLDVRDTAANLPDEFLLEVTDGPIDLGDKVDFTDEEIDA